MAQRYTAQEVADAIIETKGFITYTAKKLGCDRKTVYRYIERYDICQQAVTDARAGFLDMAEMTLHNKILDGDVTATIFALKTIGKERGYTERHEHVGLALSPDIMQLAEQIGINKSDIVREFEALIRAEADKVNNSK